MEFASNGGDARILLESKRPELVLVDPELSDMDGVEFCRRLRVWPGAPIIAMSADPSERAQLALFEAGVDDVILKPIRSRLLLARITVQLRHVSRTDQPIGEVLTVGDLRLDTDSIEAQVAGTRIPLSRHQFTVLRILVHNLGAVITPEVMARALGRSGDHKDVNAVRISISRLRQSLGTGDGVPHIVTERPGGGYRLVAPSTATPH
jgi:DNA-binding response OmpR family regulator